MAEAAPDVPFYPRPRRCVSDPEENGSANPGAVDELESDNTKLAYPNSRPKVEVNLQCFVDPMLKHHFFGRRRCIYTAMCLGGLVRLLVLRRYVPEVGSSYQGHWRDLTCSNSFH